MPLREGKRLTRENADLGGICPARDLKDANARAVIVRRGWSTGVAALPAGVRNIHSRNRIVRKNSKLCAFGQASQRRLKADYRHRTAVTGQVQYVFGRTHSGFSTRGGRPVKATKNPARRDGRAGSDSPKA